MTTAATKREVLAKAVKDWIHAPWTDESDLALETALIETNTLTRDDAIVEIVTGDVEPISLIIAFGSGFAVEIDQYGNTTKGEF